MRRFLLEHRQRLGALADTTVQALGWAAHKVVSVTPETPAVVALALMAEKGISGVGVVNTKGLIIANFSISDLRCVAAPAALSHSRHTAQQGHAALACIMRLPCRAPARRTIVAEHFGAMALPVGEFLALEHGTEFWGVDRAELQAWPRLPGMALIVLSDQHAVRVQNQVRREAKQAWEAAVHQVPRQCLCGDALQGPALDNADEHARLQNKPASMFASNRQLRRRESAGCQVGQALVLATAQETFSQARRLRALLCTCQRTGCGLHSVISSVRLL